jgi:hypothetical protein
MKEKEALVKLASSEAPAYLAQYSNGQREGFEEVQPGDMKVPRLALSQKLSPQLIEGESEYIPRLRPGEWFNTATGELYGPRVDFVPLLKFGTRILFAPLDEGGGILCRSNDMKTGVGTPGGSCRACPYAQFGSARKGEGKGTACSEFYNFPALTVIGGYIASPEPVILSMKSSHIPAAQDLIGKSARRRTSSGMPASMWMGVYFAIVKLKKFGEKLSAYIPVIDNAGWVQESDMELAHSSYAFMHELREQGRLSTDQEKDEPGASDEANS